MSTLICNKCSTSNKEGADKCATCGFPFSNNKMLTVGKYLGEFGPKPTILDAVASGAFYQKPAFSDENTSNFASKETIYENDLPSDPLAIDENIFFFNQDLLQNHHIENQIHEEKLSENHPLEIENQTESNEVAPVLETERMVRETIATLNTPPEPDEHNCVKCGYILSDFSTVCPSCGHNNIIANATMRMPLPTEATNLAPDNPEKTIAEPNVTQRHEMAQSNNRTIREGYNEEGNDVEKNYTRSNHPSEPTTKSPVRLEAIYLGQDSDQKMIINMPPHANLLNITRSLVDEGDSTISSGIHATIYKEGDEWKIENKASNKAVFVQVNDTSTIKNGDIIMMGGDKFYIFVDESNK